MNITADSYSINLQKKQNGREENIQKYYEISFDKNEANNNIITRKTIEPNASKKIEQIVSNKIEQIASKTVDTSKTIEQKASKKLKWEHQNIS